MGLNGPVPTLMEPAVSRGRHAKRGQCMLCVVRALTNVPRDWGNTCSCGDPAELTLLDEENAHEGEHVWGERLGSSFACVKLELTVYN